MRGAPAEEVPINRIVTAHTNQLLFVPSLKKLPKQKLLHGAAANIQTTNRSVMERIENYNCEFRISFPL